MIECIFTIDYEIYGNGQGSLRELVYEPAEKLKEIFLKWNVRFVNFVEVAELEMIEFVNADKSLDLVKNQIKRFYKEGFEIGLHIHPWWYNAKLENGIWHLDYSEYNLCNLSEGRIEYIINRAINYLRKILDVNDFIPTSFRAGHLLFQPTACISKVLVAYGLKVDSSVYKGGVWGQYKQDYRPALKNGYYWKFSKDVNIPDQNGDLYELPIFTKMVPIWKIFSRKRISLQRRVSSITQSRKKIVTRFKDYFRFKYPLKLDLGQMTQEELSLMIKYIIKNDRNSTEKYKPISIILHTKDQIKEKNIESLLSYLKQNKIKISTLKEVYEKVQKNIIDEQ